MPNLLANEINRFLIKHEISFNEACDLFELDPSDLLFLLTAKEIAYDKIVKKVKDILDFLSCDIDKMVIENRFNLAKINSHLDIGVKKD